MRLPLRLKAETRAAATVLLILLVISILNPLFLSAYNIGNMLDALNTIFLLGIGLTFVIMSGCIDLSVGSMLSLSSILFVLLLNAVGAWAFPLALLAGVLQGLLVGLIFVGLKIPSFIASLGLMGAYQSVAILLSRGQTAGVGRGAMPYLDILNLEILGPDPIGMMTLLFARSCGAGKSIVVGRGSRLRLSAEMGADEVFECSGAPDSLARSIKCVRRGGKVVLMGMPPQWTVDGLPIKDVIMNEIKVIGSRGNPNVSAKVVGLLAGGKISVKKLITHTFPLEKMREAMETFVKRIGGAMKVVVEP